jgi:hypothetical protein
MTNHALTSRESEKEGKELEWVKLISVRGTWRLLLKVRKTDP